MHWPRIEEFLRERVQSPTCPMCRHPDMEWIRAKEGEPFSLVGVDEEDWVMPRAVLLVCANCNFMRLHSTYGFQLDTSVSDDA
jgi:hypothetical protein